MSVLTELMDVESVQTWSETVHLGCDLDLLALNLCELGPSADTAAAVGVENANCVVSLGSCFCHAVSRY